ncbi:hypothetical protein LBW94_033840 [Nocardia sp. alder85J]|nr:hypothetical protein [Nocardia sp. alder85J]
MGGVAGIDFSLVMRCHGNKEGPFAAADVDLAIPALAAVASETLGELVIRHFVRLWETPPGDEVLRTLLRSAVTDDVVGDRVREVFAGQVMPAVLRVGDPGGADGGAIARHRAVPVHPAGRRTHRRPARRRCRADLAAQSDLATTGVSAAVGVPGAGLA